MMDQAEKRHSGAKVLHNSTMQGLVSICSSISDKSHEFHLPGTCYFGPFFIGKKLGEGGPETDKSASESRTQTQTPGLSHSLTKAREHQEADEMRLSFLTLSSKHCVGLKGLPTSYTIQ
jgi:hypothetical protein